MAAHKTADGVAGGVEAGDWSLVLAQDFGASIYRDTAHREGNAGHDSQSAERLVQYLWFSSARNDERMCAIGLQRAIIFFNGFLQCGWDHTNGLSKTFSRV